MSDKLDIVSLTERVEKLGYSFISLKDSYINIAKTKMVVKCERGHLREVTLINLRKRQECKECRKNEAFEKKYSEIEAKLTELKYIVQSIEPIQYKYSAHYKVKAICPNGHILNKLYSTYISECPICKPNRLWNFESVQHWLAENKPHLSLVHYDLGTQKADLKCSLDGYNFSTNFAGFKSHNYNCPKCSKAAKLTRDDFLKVYEAKDYKIEIGERVTARDKIPTICPEGHSFFSNIIRFRDRGDRCPECQRKCQASKNERILSDWLESLGYKVIRNDRSVLNGLEIDCFLPDFNLGIEHNGLYYHSSARMESNAHHKKFKLALEKNVKLLQFWEDDFIQKLDVIKSMILANTNHDSIQEIHARNCSVKEVDKTTSREFLIENHLLSFCGRYHLGLFFENNLVMLITYGMKNGGMLLRRIVTKKYTRVIGGQAALLKHIPLPILAKSDNLYSTGQIFQNAGFKLIEEIKPDYQYFKNLGRLNYGRYSKQSMRKTPEERLSGQTEICLRAKQNYHRIYDAGKKIWLLDNLVD